jgi:hypothetical protein
MVLETNEATVSRVPRGGITYIHHRGNTFDRTSFLGSCYEELIPVLLVEVVNNLPGSRHNLHSIRAVRVTAQSDRRMSLER